MSIYKTYNHLERCYENFFEILLNILNQVLNCGLVSAIVINKEIFLCVQLKQIFHLPMKIPWSLTSILQKI